MESEMELIEQIISGILTVVDPVRIILFGSQANGLANSESDFDICVLVDEQTGHRKISQQLYTKFIDFPKPIDFIVLNQEKLDVLSVNSDMIYKNISIGLVIYDRSTTPSRKVA